MILDKAPETVTAYPVRLADDGYGGKSPSHLDAQGQPLPAVTFKAFAIPVGFSGAGWAINSKLESQGWADVNRVRLIYKPINGTPAMDKWSRVEFAGQVWTAQEVPRLIKGARRRQTYVTVTVELKGDL